MVDTPRTNSPSCSAELAPAARITAWTVQEALSPQTYRAPVDLTQDGDPSCVVALSSTGLPWVTGETPRRGCKLYYQVQLGALRMRDAIQALVTALEPNYEEAVLRLENSRAAIAVIQVDAQGCLLPERAIALSSFAWAVPQVIRQTPRSWGSWAEVEANYSEQLFKHLARTDEHGNPVPLTQDLIERAFIWLVRKYDLPRNLIEAPSFAIRIHHPARSRTPPDPPLLNSFFLGDLERAATQVANRNLPTGLRYYVGATQHSQPLQLTGSNSALENAIAPCRTPLARWPIPGGHALVLLQQAAVNIARQELRTTSGLCAVNGPPGTGKTTLLRDLLAGCLLDRADAMTKFEHPVSAFKQVDSEREFPPYQLDSSLKGHEVLVASSNNKAVENISKELPNIDAISSAPIAPRYFKTLSDALCREQDEQPVSDSLPPDSHTPSTTWGLIAAVLGRASNRRAFMHAFWWNDDHSIRQYLKAARGDHVLRNVYHPETREIVAKVVPAIISQEQPPPGPVAALTAFHEAKRRYQNLRRRVERELGTLEALRQELRQDEERSRELQTLGEEIKTQQQNLRDAQSYAKLREQEVNAAQRDAERWSTRRQQLIDRRPGFWPRFLGTRLWREWSQEQAACDKRWQAADDALQQTKLELQQTRSSVDDHAKALSVLIGHADKLATEKHMFDQRWHETLATLGKRVISARFFALPHEAVQTTIPWVSDELNHLRAELFVASLNLHRAFIDAAAEPLLRNLGLLASRMSGPIHDRTIRDALGDLWSSLFLIVPVISTTFASIDRMLGQLPPESLGWLLIDEAGQALPQAAVGAIMRARRTVVVGDPQQIPPVITLPEQATEALFARLGVAADCWSAPSGSCQTLADRASRVQAYYNSDLGPRVVGVPLLVHRRCHDPMFGISNQIAYDGQMVHAKPGSPKSAILAELGPSCWFDIQGKGDSKWSPTEGEWVVQLLQQLADAGISDPDIFIVTPFREVASALRKCLRQESQMFESFAEPQSVWCSNRVGTIHTFQGREASAVLFVLGAPNDHHQGARTWAAGTPNIINVAVSRARDSLYVVGSHAAWSGIGYARELAQRLPLKVVAPNTHHGSGQDRWIQNLPDSTDKIGTQ